MVGQVRHCVQHGLERVIGFLSVGTPRGDEQLLHERRQQNGARVGLGEERARHKVRNYCRALRIDGLYVCRLISFRVECACVQYMNTHTPAHLSGANVQ